MWNWLRNAARTIGGGALQAAQKIAPVIQPARQAVGQTIAGLGTALSSAVGTPVRLGPGGSSLGAQIAGQGREYFPSNVVTGPFSALPPVQIPQVTLPTAPTQPDASRLTQPSTPSPLPPAPSAPSGSFVPVDLGPPPISPEEQARLDAERQQQEALTSLATFFQTTPYRGTSFDEALARSTALEAYSPYYAQLWKDYVRQYQLGEQQELQGERERLQELQAGTSYYGGRIRRLLESALEQARTGYGERGLLFSGERGRAEGLLGAERGAELENFLRGQERKTTSERERTANVLQRLMLQKEQQKRTVAEQQQTDVASAVEEARRRQQSLEAAGQLEAGYTPGQDIKDIIAQRGKILQGFV